MAKSKRVLVCAVLSSVIAVFLTASSNSANAKSPHGGPKPTRTATSTPTPTATPTPSCISITAPPANAFVSGSSVLIGTNDTCAGASFESLYVDSTHISDYAIGGVILNSTLYPNGVHSIQVTSQSANSVELGSASERLNVQNGYFPVQPSNVVLPDDPTCDSEIPATAETIINMQVAGQSFTSSNTAFNAQVPTADELNSLAANGYFYDPVYDYSQFKRITGAYPTVHGSSPSTDMILRLAACKYGIDEDVVRAQAWQESWWRQATAGDEQTGQSNCVQSSFTALYNTAIPLVDGNIIPAVPNGCYQSWSLDQTKVYYEWMTWPEIKDSTTFAAEYRDATQRTCMTGGYEYMPASYMTDVNNYLSNPNGTDPNASTWNNYPGLTNEPAFAPTYANRVMWGCIGSHYAGYHWLDSSSLPYIGYVQGNEACKRWRNPSSAVTGACSSPINEEGY